MHTKFHLCVFPPCHATVNKFENRRSNFKKTVVVVYEHVVVMKTCSCRGRDGVCMRPKFPPYVLPLTSLGIEKAILFTNMHSSWKHVVQGRRSHYSQYSDSRTPFPGLATILLLCLV